ncbi:TetR/AcrR family transcriptional regulator [Streptomyces anulatus]|uniref:TetR/AcrR family transcriptional regulator n=1 Tax=Streptomyces anulatus TaxID=1892 RepID=UPI00343BF79B
MPERLVAHAVRLLDEAGAEAVTVREVARRAGVSPRGPFRHFPDRAALLAAVAVDFGAAQTEAVASATSAPFRALGTAFVRYALAHPHRFTRLRGALFGAERTPALEEEHRAFTQSVIERSSPGSSAANYGRPFPS